MLEQQELRLLLVCNPFQLIWLSMLSKRRWRVCSLTKKKEKEIPDESVAEPSGLGSRTILYPTNQTNTWVRTSRSFPKKRKATIYALVSWADSARTLSLLRPRKQRTSVRCFTTKDRPLRYLRLLQIETSNSAPTYGLSLVESTEQRSTYRLLNIPKPMDRQSE